MPVNDFEKNVQQKMGEFQLTPSASVWNEVRERVRLENKRRRRVIFWWMLPLLIAGVGAILYFSQTENKTGDKTISHQPQGSKVAPVAEQGTEQQPADKTTASPGMEINNTVPQPPVMDKPGNNASAAANTSNNTNRTETTSTTVYVKRKPIQDNRENIVSSSVAGRKAKRNAVTPQNNMEDAVVNTTGNNPVRPVDNLPADVTGKTEEHIILTADASEPVSNRPDITVLHPAADIAANKTANKPKVKEPETKNESPLVKITQKNNWETGIVLGLGVASRTSSPLSGTSEKAQSVYAVPNASVPNSPVYTPPGALLGRSLFQAGIYTRKQITGRTAFTTGIQYANYSTKQETGMFIDSILVITSSRRSGYVRADGFYRSGKTYVFNNKYSLVQVPVLFEWQLGKGKEVPFSWVNGFTPSLLAGTNSLVFNNTTGAYYKDKTAYNSFQLFYNTGLSARFGADTKHPVTAGITLEYAITGLHKNRATEKNNLVSFGFQLKYALKK